MHFLKLKLQIYRNKSNGVFSLQKCITKNRRRRSEALVINVVL